MQVFLFGGWALLICWAIWRSSFLAKTGLKKQFFLFVFLLYAVVGCLHVWIAYYYYPGHGDIWDFYKKSLELRQAVLQGQTSLGEFYRPDDVGWQRWQYPVMVTVYALLNLLSFDSIYTDTLIFCSLGVWTKAALFQVFKDRFPEGKTATILLVFFIPSVVFWTSPIHKEAIIYECLGVLLYAVNGWLRRGFRLSGFFAIMLSLFVIFFIRKVVLLTLLPALFIWIFSEKFPRIRQTLFASTLILGIIFLILSLMGPSPTNFIQVLTEMQAEFMRLEGGSRIFLPVLDGTFTSFLKLIPFGLLNGLLMPLPGMGGQFIYSAFGMEMIFFGALVLWGGYSGLRSKSLFLGGFHSFCLVFGLTACFLVGCIVPFAGAIVRYRSIFLPFLFAPFITVLCHHPKLSPLAGRVLHWIEAKVS